MVLDGLDEHGGAYQSALNVRTSFSEAAWEGGSAHRVGAIFDGLDEHGGLSAHLHCPPIGRRYLRLRRQLIPAHCSNRYVNVRLN